MGRRHRGGGAAFGIVLITFGAILLLDRLDIVEHRVVWAILEYWPLMFVAWGLFRIVQFESPRRVGGGVTTLMLGLWFLASEMYWYGLSWSNSWPLVLVAIGSGMVVRAMLERGWPQRSGAEEVRDEHC